MGYIGSTCIGRNTLNSRVSAAPLIYQCIAAGSRRKSISPGIKSLLDTYINRLQAGIGDSSGDGILHRERHRYGVYIIAKGIEYLNILRISIRCALGTGGITVSIEPKSDPEIIATQIVIKQLSPYYV